MTDEKILTHDSEDRKRKLVQCQGCRDVFRCLPRSDSYTLGRDEHLPEGTRPLYCHGCMLDAARRRE